MDIGSLIVGVAFGAAIFSAIIYIYQYLRPEIRFRKYLCAYKIGRLEKLAKEQGVEFVFEIDKQPSFEESIEREISGGISELERIKEEIHKEPEKSKSKRGRK